MTYYAWLTVGFIAACVVLLVISVISFIRQRNR